MDGLDLLSLTLATGYWAHAISKTHGPFGVFQALREKFPLGGLTTCPVCLSIWISIAMYGLLQTPVHAVVTISAVAGGATLAGYYTGMYQR